MWKFLAMFIVFQQLACQSDQEFSHEYSMGKMHHRVSESAKKKETLWKTATLVKGKELQLSSCLWGKSKVL